MTRMARTQTNIRGATNGLAGVRTQMFQQGVTQVQSESAGLDPFRGDLTNAFNQFFGSIKNDIKSVQNTNFEIEKTRASEFAADMKARAVTEATDYYVTNPKSADVTTALETEETSLQSNRHFVNTYKQTLGSNIGSRLYSDFTAAQANRNPASFESNAQSFWKENFQEGTGDPQVDLAMQDSFNRNYENNRIGAAQETIRRQRAAANLEHTRNIYRTMQEEGVSVEVLNSLMTGGSSNGQTAGQVTSKNLGIVFEAAQNMSISADQATTIQAWMDMVPTGPNGETGQSVSQKFPIMAAKFEARLPGIRARAATLEGMEVAQTEMTEFNTAMSGSDEMEKLTWLQTTAPASLEKLRSTPGVSSSVVAQYRKDVTEAVGKAVVYQGNVTDYTKLAAGVALDANVAAPSTNAEKKAYFDVWNGLNSMGQGDMLRNSANQFGEVPAAVTGRIRAVLSTGTPEQQSEMYTTLLQAAGDGATYRADIAETLLPDDRSKAIFDSIRVNSQIMPQTAAITMALSSDRTNAALLVEEAGGDVATLGGVKADVETVSANLYGRSMDNRLLQEIGEDGYFWNPTVRMDANTKSLVLSTARQVALTVAGEGFDLENDDTTAEILSRTARIVGPQLALWGDTLTTGQAYRASANRDAVQLSAAVRNPITGGSENTLSTLNSDLTTLDGGLRKLSNIGDATYSLVQDPNNPDTNQFMVMADDAPVSFMVNQKLYTDPRYNEDGERLGIIGNAINWNTSLTLTGDIQQDREALASTLGPGIVLIPDYQNGVHVGYHLNAKPRFTKSPALSVAEREERFNRLSTFEQYNPLFNTDYPDRRQQQQNLNVIPDDYWDTEAGEALQLLIDNRDPTADIAVQNIARQFNSQ